MFVNEYPYPVLLEEDSSYKKDIEFTLEYDKEFFADKEIRFKFKVMLTSDYLKKNIDCGFLKAVIKMQSNIFITTVLINPTKEDFAIVRIPTSVLTQNDTLKFTAYILANDNFELTYNNELVDMYDSDYCETVKRNSVLAISNQEVLSYNPSNNDFIKFAVVEDMKGKGFNITFGDKHIIVNISPEFNEAYGRVKNNFDINTIFGAHLVFEVFVYTLVEVVQREGFEEEWYDLFIQMLEQTVESFDDFKMKVIDDERIQMDKIFECAHLLTNNYIEKSLILISQREDL